MSRTVRLSVFVALFVSLPAAADAPPESLAEYARRLQGRHAYATYVKKVKVGWSVDDVKLGKHEGKPVLISTEETFFSVLRDGEKSVKKEKRVTYYSLEGEGSIILVERRAWEDKKEVLRKAVRKGKGMVVTTTSGTRTTERTIPLPKHNLAELRRFEGWLKSAEKGATFVRWGTDWEGDKIDVKETYTFQEKKSVVWNGAEVPVYATRAVSQGAHMNVQVLPNGIPFAVELAGGLLSVRLEKEAFAKKLDAKAVDLMHHTSVLIERDLGHRASRVEKLTLEVTGLGEFKLPQSHRQRLRPGKDKKVVLELERDSRQVKGAALGKAERAEHTKATPRVQCDHEDMRRKALAIIGKEKDALKQAELLKLWVFRKVRKTYAENADNALAVLDSLAGDCTEHTLLFVALARAVGLPAREVGGLAYVRVGGKPQFGWHAWAEVHDGTQWVSIDPTWNQTYVDATHIKFSEGDDQAWINVVGAISIKVLSVQTK
jgi:hypothetical protein